MYKKTTPNSIQNLFQAIAPYYDKTNALLSFGLHAHWNRALIKKLNENRVKTLLDLCAGTGEIGINFCNSQEKQTILLDFCPEMLSIARKKALSNQKVSFMVGDAQQLPFENESFDGISVAYGIRNVNSPLTCFKETFRVLKPGGVFAILELTRPKNKWLAKGHSIYLKTMIPTLGKLMTKNKEAYAYLSSSISTFLSPDALEVQLISSGFREVVKTPLSGGIVHLIEGKKPL